MPNYKKMKMAIGGPSDVETREEYKGRRMAETETRNLRAMDKVAPNPLYDDMRSKVKETDKSNKEREMRMRMKQLKKRDPFANG